MKIYDKSYSDYYDILYKDKDYKKETDFIYKILEKYSYNDGKLLSLGCGTCNYEIVLAKKGYKVTGIDRSSEMLAIAKKKIEAEALLSKINVTKKDVRSFTFKDKYAACMAMFNIVGYQTENEDFEKMLRNVGNSLKKGGTFIFDCWYLPAVLKDKPKNKIKRIKTDKGFLIRVTKSGLQINKNVIEINFDVTETGRNKKIIGKTNESHFVRYWSLPELKYFLNKAGFEIVKVCNFLNEESSISDNNWNIFVVARKRL